MDNSSSREKILQRIAAANKRPAFVEAPSTGEIYKPVLPDAITCFRNELEAVNGQCIVCENEAEVYTRLKSLVDKSGFPLVFCRDAYLTAQLQMYEIPVSQDESDFADMQAGITGCEFLVARTGSVVVTSSSPSGRQMNVFPPVHLVIAHVSQLVAYPEDAIAAIREKYGDFLPSTISFVTGPSRTADIEKTLVLGAHGPKEFIVFLSKE